MPNIDSINQEKITIEAFKMTKELYQSIKEDLLYAFLFLSGEFTLNNKYTSIKDNIIASKYYVAFLNKNIENYLLNNKFKFPSSIIEYSSFLANIKKTETKQYEHLKTSLASEIANDEIASLLELNISDKNINTFIEVLLRNCFLRSAFLLLDDEQLLVINDAFHELVDNEEDFNENKKLIISCFNAIKKDRQKKRVLSLED